MTYDTCPAHTRCAICFCVRPYLLRRRGVDATAAQPPACLRAGGITPNELADNCRDITGYTGYLGVSLVLVRYRHISLLPPPFYRALTFDRATPPRRSVTRAR